ncbi:retrovirus-related pol polyprotein from transposon TNT 1-94 [Tanacetum coccineum]
MKKRYCLVVTDGCSRFSWVFFLATNDETNEILKKFITGIENLIDLRVKVIRCDNGTEFKNRVMNQFCEMKGIKREFSVARTPQKNKVAERKSRTLIEAARTMLADLKLLTTFWAEAVNTACYVQNRVLVIKPHNKTPYELFLGKARMETVPGKDYILLPMSAADPLFSQDSKSSPDAGFKPSGEEEKKDAKDPRNEDSEVPSTEEPREDQRVNQELDDSINNTNNINTASDRNNITNVNAVSSTVNDVGIEVNVVDQKTSIKLPNDPNMLELEDIVYSDDDEDVGAKADINNLDAFMPVSPIPTTRIYKDHPVEQIIGDLSSAPQTRRMIKNLKEQGLFSSVQQRTNHKDFQNCMFACFLSQEEPKKVIQALKDPSWIEATQDELLQFKLQKVWTLVDLPNGKRAIGTKWVYRNKKDEGGIVIKNKARLVAHGYTQEEGGAVAIKPAPIFAFLLSLHDPPDLPVSSTAFLFSLLFDRVSQLIALRQSCYIPLDAWRLKCHQAWNQLGQFMELICFWDTVKVKMVNEEVHLHALVDRKKVIITESIIRRDPQLEDAEEETKTKEAKEKRHEFTYLSGSLHAIADEAANEENVLTHSNDLLLSDCSSIGDFKFEVESQEGRYGNDLVFDITILDGEVVTTANVEVSVATTTTITAITKVDLTLAQALAELRSVKPKVVDKGKAKMIEPEKPLKKTEQIRLDEELAFKLQAKEEEQATLVREKANKVEEANISWDNVQAMIEADRLLAERLQAREQEELTDKEKARLFVELLEKRRKHFAALRAQEKRNKPPTKAEKKSIMSTYLKYMAGYKQSQLKNNSKRAGEELEQEVAKKQKMEDDKEKEDLKQCFEIVQDDKVAIDAIPLATKPAPIFDIEDMENIWKLVKAKHGNTRPEEGYERVLWGDLKTMFEHHVEDLIWRNLQGKKVLLWRLYDSCGIHFVRFEDMHVYMLVEKRYPLTPATITDMLNKKLKSDYCNEMCYLLLKLMTKQLKKQ